MTAPQLRKWRDRLGLSQARAAAALGVSLRTYKRWEQDGPQYPTLVRLACAALENAEALK